MGFVAPIQTQTRACGCTADYAARRVARAVDLLADEEVETNSWFLHQ